ncbi:MAG: H+-transporting two-sector ATPase, subunit [Phycisphaerales bacterium]|nr:H+-transporting two-sector ATPase, subunit [Phycisphaerales bacterium]
MPIDWFTVAAQALNFLALVWLLKRFLYKPVLDAIDAREKRVAAELAGADADKAAARTDREAFQQKNDAFDRERAALMSKATDEAKAERRRLIDDANRAADAAAAQRRDAMRADADHLRQAVARRTQDEVFAIARQALADLADTALEERMVDVLIRRLRQMDSGMKDRFAEAVRTAPDAAVVRTAFDLPPDRRAAVQQAVDETFAADVRLRFETAPDVVAGIELSANGQKLAWTFADHLSSLAAGVDELVDGPGPTAPPQPLPLGPAVAAKAS